MKFEFSAKAHSHTVPAKYFFFKIQYRKNEHSKQSDEMTKT